VAAPETCTFEITPCLPHQEEAARAVIRTVYAEYGFTWDRSHYFDDLHDVAGHYFGRGGIFWVLRAIPEGAPDAPRVIGTIGVTPHADGECELHRLYLQKDYRGRRLGQRLLDTALAWSRERGFTRMIAWSDVKLPHAHVLYRANGFVQRGERIVDDPDHSREYGFQKSPL
jgi:putative acetyltransferase